MGQSYYLVKPLSGEFRELSPPFPDFDPQGGGLNSKGVLNSPKLTQKVKFLAPRAFDARQKPHFWTFWRSALRADHPFGRLRRRLFFWAPSAPTFLKKSLTLSDRQGGA